MHEPAPRHRTAGTPARTDAPAPRRPDRPGGSVASMLHLQRTAGNRAVSAAVQRQVGGSAKGGFSFPEAKSPKRSVGGYVTAQVAIGGSVDYTITPPGGGGGPISVSGGSSLSPDAAKYQVEVERQFNKIADGWLQGFTPSVKIGGEANSNGGYKLGVEGGLGGEKVDFSLGFAFLEADGKGEISFATLEAAATLKHLSFTFVAADGTTVQVSAKPTAKLAIEPDYAAMLRFFLQRCAAVVSAEVLIIGGAALAGAAAIGGYLLTINDGKKIAAITEQAVLARGDYINGFMAGITPGNDYSFDNDYKMEGYLRGSQWLRDLRTGAGREGLPIPESVLKQKVAEHQAQARGAATAAINAYLHQLLVKQYWEIHWGRKFMGYPIETIFQMLLEYHGFGRPAPHETGDEPSRDVAIAAP
jgi:hypothetical protein